MIKYVAFLRGIGPGNPNMHGSKLKSVLEDLGFTNVSTLISSGNVIFESGINDSSKIEKMLEAAWPEKLGFNSMTIVRSEAQLKALVAQKPYKELTHNRDTYLLVTFFKNPPKKTGDNYYKKLEVNALCSNINTNTTKTPDLMSKLEREYSKEITSRTWNTIQRVLKKMEN
jgi:uncharacterized protein (DUF1697 family)